MWAAKHLLHYLYQFTAIASNIPSRIKTNWEPIQSISIKLFGCFWAAEQKINFFLSCNDRRHMINHWPISRPSKKKAAHIFSQFQRFLWWQSFFGFHHFFGLLRDFCAFVTFQFYFFCEGW